MPKEGLCESCTAVDISSSIERDADGYTTSVTWTFKKYDNINYQYRTFTVDADGNTEDILVPTWLEENLIKTATATYEIPVDQRTTCTHEEPHDHDNEMTFQAANALWSDTWKASAEGQAFWEDFNAV